MIDLAQRWLVVLGVVLLGLSPAVALASDGGSVDPLIVDVDLAICTVIVFLVTLGVLWKFAWGPIAEGLTNREQAIADNIAAAESAAAEAHKLTSQYEAKLAGATDDVRKMIEKARHDAEHTSQQIVEKAQAKASEEGRRMLREVATAKDAALKDISDLGTNLAVDLAGRIVRRELTDKDHADLIAKAQADFVSAKPSNN